MSWYTLLSDIAMGISDAKYFLGGLGEILREGTAEIAECLTDGAVEMIIKGNADYKTSYEIRDDAQDIINNAEGKLFEKTNEVKKRFEDAEAACQALCEKEESLLRDWSDVCINKYMLKREDLEIFSSCYCPDMEKGFFDFGTFLGVLGNSLRKSMAKEYLERAKSYQTEVNMKCAQYSETLARLEAIANCMEEERKLLTVLENAATRDQRMTNEWLVNILKQLVVTHVCDENGVLSEGYRLKIQQLKKEVKMQ